jgi:hypothetical protein
MLLSGDEQDSIKFHLSVNRCGQPAGVPTALCRSNGQRRDIGEWGGETDWWEGGLCTGLQQVEWQDVQY